MLWYRDSTRVLWALFSLKIDVGKYTTKLVSSSSSDIATQNNKRD